MLPDPDIRSAHAALVTSLGGTIAALPAPVAPDLLEIGRLGALPCVSARGAPAAAIATARLLARRGRPALLLADDPPTGRRTLVVSITPVRPAVVAVGDAGALPLLRLQRVQPHRGLLGMATAVATALDVDAAGRRAFRDLREGITAAIDRLDGRIRRDARHGWVMLQVTRLLFLRFVEAEGWLDGDPAFLQHAIDDCLSRGGDPARRLLYPLFFGTLNRSNSERGRRARAFGAVPFLNGGLFEPHPLERAHRWQLPVDAWRNLFELTVTGIEVSLDAGDVGDRVNPELLGRVFEGVMDPDERRVAGTFYTPMALVPALVRESYACHLARHLDRPADRILEQFEDPDEALATALLQLRVLDPAVGSGAFLVGALQLARGTGTDQGRRTRHLVARRLFGVDRNPAAVRLTELRLWLEVLRTMRGRPTSRVTPLPNLDTTVRAGDALLDPLGGTGVPRRLARELRIARRAVVQCHGTARRRALLALREMERDAMRHALERHERRLERAIADLLEPGQARTLFGERGSLPRGTTARLGTLRRAATALRRERRRLATADAAPIFAIESAFAPELARGGFDLVLGNPPWVRAERVPRHERDAIAARYRWWRGSGTGWRHLPDLSVAFVERAMELLASGGTLGLLLPAKLATAQYAAACRAALVHRTTVHVAADLSSDPRAGFEATTYPMALITTRRHPEPTHAVHTHLGGAGRTVAQQEWRARGVWTLADPEVATIAARLASRHPPLRDAATLSLGVKTGANEVYLDPPAQLREWTRPVLRGRDLLAHGAAPTRRILWPADAHGHPWASLPAEVAAYLAPHRSRLERRADLHDSRWWRLFRCGPATARWRVAWPDLARDLHPVALLDQEPVPLNSCYVIACSVRQRMLMLATWLRATPIRALARLDAEPAANGYARFGSRAVGGVPFPEAAPGDEALLALAMSADPDPADRDAEVCRLLGLDGREARLLDAFASAGR